MTAILIPDELRRDVIETRRAIHAQPELGFEETSTSKLIASRLQKFGYDVHTGIAETGVVGVLRGKAPGRTIMLRADMDALPIDEENSHAFRSRVAGKMHACGHDGHVAILLGAAALIADRKEDISGTVCLLFQPAEEGRGGAKRMIDEGVIERFEIERAYGLHLLSRQPVGTLGFREGALCASGDTIEVKIRARGGHGAMPHETPDPIVTAATFITSLQQVVSRFVDPMQPAVVTIGAIHGGTIHNVIPASLQMLGTVRAFSDDVRSAMPERIERVLKACCEMSGAQFDFTYDWRYPVTANDPEQARYARQLATTLGEERVLDIEPLTGSEDFSFFAQRVPACFFTLGSQGGPSSANAHHSSTFDIDERALEVGVQMMTALALDAPRHSP